MSNQTKIKLFENSKVRSIWDSEQEKWYISVVDVIEVLTEIKRPRKYWDDLKRKLLAEGSELSEKIGQFKMQAPDGKMRLTDVADVEQLFRLVQSIPSPKAEPFKMWLSQFARERLEEEIQEFTDEWERRGVKKGQEFSILTDIITKEWSGIN